MLSQVLGFSVLLLPFRKLNSWKDFWTESKAPTEGMGLYTSVLYLTYTERQTVLLLEKLLFQMDFTLNSASPLLNISTNT